MRKLLLSALVASATGAFAQLDLTDGAGGTITYCASHGQYNGTMAFDNGGYNESSRWLANGSTLPNSWVQYEFPTATCVAGYKVVGFGTPNNGLLRNPRSWTFEGSNDGSAWTLLDSQSDQTGWTAYQERVFQFDNSDSYTHYRFTITANNGMADYTGVVELEFYGNPNTPGVPSVNAGAAASTNATKATLHAALFAGGTSDLTFHWGVAPGIWTGSQTFQDVSPVEFSGEITGLDLYRTYYWTVYAENAHGSAWASTTNSFVSATGADFTSPDGIITGCDSLSGFGPEKAFDNILADNGRWLPFVTNFPNAFVQYQFAEGPYEIRAYRVTGLRSADFATRSPKEWTLSGSHNGTDWTLIDSQVNQTGWTESQQRTFAVSPLDSYDYFRFNIVTNNGASNYSGVLELEFFGFPDFTTPPEVVSDGVEQTVSGSAILKGTLTAGGSADVFAAWGASPDELSNTNSIGTTYNGPFGIPVSGLTPFQTYYYTIIAENTEGSHELDDAPLSFVASGEQFTWIGTSGNWEDSSKWSQGTRSPDAPGDLVTINSIRTLTLHSPSVTIGGLTVSGPYASGPIVITNAVPDRQIVFDNPAGEAYINANVGGAAPYLIYPDLALNEDVNVSSTETYPVQLRGGVTGPGRLIQQSGARIHLAPVQDVVLDSVFNALAGNSYLSIGGPAVTTLRGTNTVSFWGTWSANSALLSGASLVLDGADTEVTDITTSTRATWTYSGYTGASLAITNGARLVKISTNSGPIFDGSNNRAIITGQGSTWALGGVDFRFLGTSNQLVVADGGAVGQASLTVRGSRSSVLITGANTLWDANGTFCIGLGNSLNTAEISNGAVVSNCVLLVAGRHGYDIGGGYGNSLVLSGGAKIYSTRNQSLSDGGGVGVAGRANLTTAANSILVTGEGSELVLGAFNFNIGYMQESYATGGWNRVSVADRGMITNVPNLFIGRVSGTTQQSWSNSLSAASSGEIWVNNSINVGDTRSTGNRIEMAGGRIAAQTLNVKAGNGIAAVLGGTGPVPAEFAASAVFEAGTYVWPELAEGADGGVGGVILTAPQIVDGGLELGPEVDPAYWRLVKTATTISLHYQQPATVIIVR